MATVNLSLTDTLNLNSVAGLSRVVSGQADLFLIETLRLASTASINIIYYLNANSAITLSDVVRISVEYHLSASSAITLSDVVRISVEYHLSIADSISLVSVAGLSTQRVYSLTLTESLGLTSTAIFVKQYTLTQTEVLSLTSTASLTITGRKYITYIKFTQYPTQVYVNKPYTYQAQLFSITEGKPLSGKTVYFSVDGKLVSTVVTDDNGLATTSITINTVGKHEVEVRFPGDEIYDYSLAIVDVYAVTPAPPIPIPWWIIILLLLLGAVAVSIEKKEQAQY